MPASLVTRLGYRVSGWNRSRKWETFTRELQPTESTTILNVGYTDLEYFSDENFLEKHYPWRAQVTALGIEEPVNYSRRYPEVKVVTYDGRSTWPFPDASFDIVWSNAVLEHVGDRDAQVHFLAEARRVGRRVFVTTPNRGFPIEVHSRLPIVHWGPKPVLDAALRAIGRPECTGDYMRLLSARELRGILRDAGYASDYRLIRNRLGGPTLDFVVVA